LSHSSPILAHRRPFFLPQNSSTTSLAPPLSDHPAQINEKLKSTFEHPHSWSISYEGKQRKQGPKDFILGLLAVEAVRTELDETRHTSRATNEDVGLVNLRVTKDLLDGLQGAADSNRARVREVQKSINALEKRVGLDGRLGGRGEGAHGAIIILLLYYSSRLLVREPPL